MNGTNLSPLRSCADVHDQVTDTTEEVVLVEVPTSVGLRVASLQTGLGLDWLTTPMFHQCIPMYNISILCLDEPVCGLTLDVITPRPTKLGAATILGSSNGYSAICQDFVWTTTFGNYLHCQ